MKARLLLLLVPVIAVVAVAAIGTVGASAGPQRPERLTEQRTLRWLEAFNRHDYAAVEALLDPNVTLLHRMTTDGAQDPGPGFVGRGQVLAYFRGVHQLIPRTAMNNLRVSVTAGGTTSFVQFDGDFTTADGRPYRNVYIWRADWRAGRLVAIEEYANPVTFCITFPTSPDCPT